MSGGGGPASSLAPGATGTTLVLSGAATALQFISTQVAGADAFLANTAGARVHFSAAGVGDYIASDGTNLSTPAIFDALRFVAQGNVIRGAAGSFGLQIQTAATDGVVTPTAGAYVFIPDNAFTTGDAIVEVLESTGTAAFRSMQGGRAQIAGDINLTSYTDDSANAGNRTVNKARGKNAIAALAQSCVITNSFVTVNSQVLCTLETNDATLTFITTVIPSGTGFTIRGNAASTADVVFSWVVIN